MSTAGVATATPADRLAAAEARFESGDVAGAHDALSALLGHLEEPALRAQACNDLAVIAVHRGRPSEGRAWALRAVAEDRDYPGALETLGLCCEAAGDFTAAVHWLRAASRQAPGEASLLFTLGRCEARRGRLEAAEAALGAGRAVAPAGADDPRLAGEIAARRALRPAPSAAREPGEPGRVLICVNSFHPSVGGTERLAEGAGTALQALGWHVEVTTARMPARRRPVHRGMRIHEIREQPVEELERIARRREADAILSFAPPSWPLLAPVLMPPPRPRFVAVPCINEEIYSDLTADGDRLREYRTLLRGADVLGYSSHAGWDARLLTELGLPGVYLPNPAEAVAPAGAFRRRHAIAEDVPLLLAVGNLFREKNHVALVRELRERPGDWRLVIVGAPAPSIAPEVPAALHEAMAGDPRIVHVPGAPAPEIAAAMREASLLLLPSKAEATPLVLVEAMAHRLPWIATPTCGSAADHAGGLIVPVEHFGAAVDALLDDAGARERLGEAGHEHWRASYTWDRLGPRYGALLAGDPAGAADPLEVPAPALAATDEIRAGFYDGALLGG